MLHPQMLHLQSARLFGSFAWAKKKELVLCFLQLAKKVLAVGVVIIAFR